MKGFAGDTAKAHAKTSMIAGEGVSNIRTVAAFNAQDKILSLFCSELRVPQMHSLRRSQISKALVGASGSGKSIVIALMSVSTARSLGR